jgi:hypothetical protein
MNHSFFRLIKNSLAVLLLLSIYNISFSQDENIPVEPSENWLNSQHKPVELLGRKC